MYFFYILHSKTLDKFYTGHTNDLESRLSRHNTRHKGYTGKASDWRIVYTEQYSTKSHAYERERQVKSWKSRQAILNLLKQNFSKD